MIDAIAVQMCSGPDPEANIAQLWQLLRPVVANGESRIIVLPENFAGMGGDMARIQAVRPLIEEQLKALAIHCGAWLVAGSLPTPPAAGLHASESRFYSRCQVFNPQGHKAGSYDKIHLFDAQVGDSVGAYRESDHYLAGSEVVTVKTPFATLGLLICYDLRFPELAVRLRQQGADILVCPAAFTVPTGQRHWARLLASRALDSQCWLIGADQCGERAGRQTWGHSAIVNHDGDVVVMADQWTPGLARTGIDLSAQQQFRHNLPVFSHRRL